MMNTRKSSIIMTWKYLLFIPVISLTIFLFNPSTLSSHAGYSAQDKNVMFIITADASEEELNYIEEETEKYGYTIEFSDLIWDQNEALEKIKIDVSTGISINTNFNDLNRHQPIVIYICPEGNYGTVDEGPLTKELLHRYKSSFDGSDEDLIVLNTFANNIRGLEELTHSEEFEQQIAKFSKEENWQNTFNNDVLNNTNSFHYFLDGNELSAVELSKKMKLRDIRDIYVIEIPSGKTILQVHSNPFDAFQMEASSIIPYYNRQVTFKKYITEEHMEIENRFSEQDVKIVYLLDGVETKNILNKLDSSSFSKLYIQQGRNFDAKGNYLGYEIKVNHLQKD